MGYADYLKQMLSGLGVYNLQSGYSASELCAVGNAMDEAEAVISTYLDENGYTENIFDYFGKRESLFPIINFPSDVFMRTLNVIKLMSVDDSWSDKASLETILDACGLASDIVETDEKFAVELRFTTIRGELNDGEKQVCRAIMPAHIDLKYVCDGLTWNRAEALYPTWDELDNAGLTVYEIMKLE